MDVINRLPSFSAAVEDQSVAALAYTEFIGEAVGGEHHPSDQSRVGGFQVVDGGDVSAGDNQDVVRRLGVDVAEGDEVGILINDVGFKLAGGDAAEEAVGHK